MLQRGRRGVAQLGFGEGQIAPLSRPDPPPELTAAEAQIWRETVGAMKSDWFGRETWPLLTLYCRHVAIARVLAKEIQVTSLTDDLARVDKLLGMQVRESAAISRLATRMRLTHQSSTNSRNLKRDPTAGLKKPWER